MKTIKIILGVLAFLSISSVSHANFAVPWNATSTTQGWIFPTLVNGYNQGIFVQGNSGCNSISCFSGSKNASTTFYFLGGTGGYVNSISNPMGNGSGGSILGGNGGGGDNSSFISNPMTGGNGGSYSILGGNGGNANDICGACAAMTGGNGGDITISGGAKGTATLGSSNVNGRNGNVLLAPVQGNIGSGTTSPYANLSIHANNGSTNTMLFVVASSTVSATTTHFAVMNTGNVGIGTASPTSKLTMGSGQIEIPQGSAASPSITFTNDRTTGIYGDATSGIYFSTNGSNYWYISASGNMWSPFRVIGPADGDAGGPGHTFNADSTTGMFRASNTLGFSVGGAEKVRITSLGYLGIGTTSPYATLSVQSGASTGDAFVVATSTGKTIGGYDNDGHGFTSGPTPALGACGTGSPTITGDDQTGTITTGTAASSCAITFSKAYRNTPVCNISSDSTASVADISAISTTAVTFGLSVGLSGGHLYYQCSYHR